MHCVAQNGVYVYGTQAKTIRLSVVDVSLYGATSVGVAGLRTREGTLFSAVSFIFAETLVMVVTWIKTWSTIRVAKQLRVEMSFTSLVLNEGILYFW